MKTVLLPHDYQHISPAGAEVRVLMQNTYVGVAQCTLIKNKISKAVCHKTVSEIWTVIAGKGQIWRKQNAQESITDLSPGITIDIPVGTSFQYRSVAADLVFICVTTPPWPGADEVFFVDKGAWEPTQTTS